MSAIDRAREKLQEVFGFEDFLDGQETVIDEILSGRDGSVVMPTGGGKSLCYQLPALCREGVTLVVSPLIALMKDRVDALEGDEKWGLSTGLYCSGAISCELIYECPKRRED